jgi:hypothetical protein
MKEGGQESQMKLVRDKILLFIEWGGERITR